MLEFYQKYKGLLFKLAYQLTGSASDAEDVVHDVFLKLYSVSPEKLAEPKAYLCKMVVNRCRDIQKSARKKREQYYGEWLPEPLSDSMGDSMERIFREEQLSYGILVLLERLTSSERVVFVLREALGFEYYEIAKLIEKTEANCRKLFSRAKAKLEIDPEEKVLVPEADSTELIHAFLVALKNGNTDKIISMLDKNAVLVSDGGGKVTASVDPIETGELVAQFLIGPVRNSSLIDGISHIDVSQINGQSAFIIRSSEGIQTVGMFVVEKNKIRNVYIVRNPDKLKHVGI